jgi:hypothetical protein
MSRPSLRSYGIRIEANLNNRRASTMPVFTRFAQREAVMEGNKDVAFSPGQLYRRRDLQHKFGGQRQGGISTPAKAPFILLITGESGNPSLSTLTKT